MYAPLQLRLRAFLDSAAPEEEEVMASEDALPDYSAVDQDDEGSLYSDPPTDQEELVLSPDSE